MSTNPTNSPRDLASVSASAQSPIAIVGMGCLFPKANDKQSFWRVLRSGQNCISEIPSTHWSANDYFDADHASPDRTYAKVGGFLEPYDFDPTEFSIPPSSLEATDTTQLLGLVGAKLALEDAGYGPNGRPIPKESTSVILGVTGTLELVIPLGARLGFPYWRKALNDAGIAPATREKIIAQIAGNYVPWQENSFPGLLGNVVAGRIANKLDLHGTNCVVDAACASSLAAVHLALAELQSKRADLVLTGGCDTFNDIFMYMCFSKTPALSESGAIRPFAEDSDGTLLGEGIGIVALKRLEDAERDNDRIYAVIRGIGSSSDGAGSAIYAPSAQGQKRALVRAYQQTGVDPNTIDLVEAHGTGTKVGDQVEFSALSSVYSEAHVPVAHTALGTVKSQIGHTKASAGAASLCKVALALYNKVLLPTINVDKPNSKYDIEHSAFYLNKTAKPWLAPTNHPRRAALSSFGFGGSNFHVILEEHNKRRLSPAWDGSAQIFAFSATTREDLIASIAKASQSKTSDLAWTAYLSRQQFQSKQAFRATLASAPASALNSLADLAKALQEDTKLPSNCFVGTPDTEAGRIAFLFSGQGSQYVNMAQEYATIFPEFLDNLQLAAECLPTEQNPYAKIYPPTSFADEAIKRQASELTDTRVAQPALAVVDTSIAQLLQSFNVRPQALAGHSYGELVALRIAGCMTTPELLELSATRGSLMAAGDGGRGAMLAVSAPLAEIDQLAEELGDDIVLANRNHPKQGVLSGTKEAIAKAQEICAQRHWTARLLQVSAAFHSPLMSAAHQPFSAACQKLDFQVKNLGKDAPMQVYSNYSGDVYPRDKEQAIGLLANQLLHSVRFVEIIEHMYANGVRTFVEVGPKAILGGLVHNIMGTRPHFILGTDSRKGGHELMVLAATLAQLAAIGVPVALDKWEEAVKQPKVRRMTVSLSGANYRNPNSKSTTPWVDPKEPIEGYQPLPATQVAATSSITVSALTSAVKAELNGSSRQADKSKPSTRKIVSLPTLPLPVDETAPTIFKVSSATGTTLANSPHFGASQQFSYANKTTKVIGNGSANNSGHKRTEVLTKPKTSVDLAHQARESVTVSSPVSLTNNSNKARDIMANPNNFEQKQQSQMDYQANGSTVGEAFRTIQEGLMAMQSLQQQTAQAHRHFLESQEQVQRAFQALITNQQLLAQQTMSGVANLMPLTVPAPAAQPPAPGSASLHFPPMPPQAPATNPISSPDYAPAPLNVLPAAPKAASAPPAVPVAPVATPAPVSAPAVIAPLSLAPQANTPALSLSSINHAVLAIVADKTGYPVEMLTQDMDLEADLGIDSIKRVEILAAIEEQLPGVNAITPDEIGSLHTLKQVIDRLNPTDCSSIDSPVQASNNVAQVNTSSADTVLTTATITPKVLAIVSDKTGYPVEMLTLDMDLEADLGIDSIKRVEILAAIEEQLPNAQTITPDQIGTLRTLGQVVAHLVPDNQPDGPQGGQPIATAEKKTDGVATSVPENAASLALASAKAQVAACEAAPGGGHWGVPLVEMEQVAPCRCVQRRVLKFCPEQDGSSTVGETAKQAPQHTSSLVCTGPYLLSDDGYLAPALQAQLEALGQKVTVAPLADIADPHNILQQHFSAVLLLIPQSLNAQLNNIDSKACNNCSSSDWDVKDEELLKCAFKAAQACLSTPLELFAIVTRLDGEFGSSGHGFNPVLAGIHGLNKVIPQEFTEITCKSIDIEPSLEADIAACGIICELKRPGNLEVALSHGSRLLPVLSEASFTKRTTRAFPRDGVIIITGGARGVTASCAKALARALHPTLVLLGRSPNPEPEQPATTCAATPAQIKQVLFNLAKQDGIMLKPAQLEAKVKHILANREITQTLQEIADTGCRVVYIQVDVRQGEALRQALADIRQNLGPIQGLIHGAGVLADRKILDKTAEQFNAVFDTKVQGLRHLLAALKDDDLHFMLFFSSVTARFGRPGQSDYAMANEVMNKVARLEANKRPHTHVAALGWGPWDGGMVNDGLRKEFARIGAELVDRDRGAQTLVEEILKGYSHECEVILGSGFSLPPVTTNIPCALSRKLSLEENHILNSHVFNSQAVLPMALMLEWMSEAALKCYPTYTFLGVDNLQVQQKLVVKQEQDTLQIAIGAAWAVPLGLTVEAKLLVNERIYATCQVILSRHPQKNSLPQFTGKPIPENGFPCPVDEAYREFLFHGPELQGISKISGCSEQGLVAQAKRAPQPQEWFNTPRSSWVTDPLLLDCALQTGLLWTGSQKRLPSLPVSIAHYRQYAQQFPPTAQVLLYTSQATDSQLCADLFIVDQGRLLASLKDVHWALSAALKQAFVNNTLK